MTLRRETVCNQKGQSANVPKLPGRRFYLTTFHHMFYKVSAQIHCDMWGTNRNSQHQQVCRSVESGCAMKNKIGFILGIIISFVGLAATIMLALHTPLMIAFQYWWAF